MKPPAKRTRPLHPGPGPYRQLWRLVDGAVADAIKCHPDYVSEKGHRYDTARRSIVKRVVGAVLGYAGQATSSRAQGRSETTHASAAHNASHDLQS